MNRSIVGIAFVAVATTLGVPVVAGDGLPPATYTEFEHQVLEAKVAGSADQPQLHAQWFEACTQLRVCPAHVR